MTFHAKRRLQALGRRASFARRPGARPIDRSRPSVGTRSPTDGFSGRRFWETFSSNRKPRFAGLSWAGQDSNLRSSDYELRVRRGALIC
jgi:hypothetical protein